MFSWMKNKSVKEIDVRRVVRPYGQMTLPEKMSFNS